MRAIYLCLATLLIVPHADAAPGHKAKEKPEALKKPLPDLRLLDAGH